MNRKSLGVLLALALVSAGAIAYFVGRDRMPPSPSSAAHEGTTAFEPASSVLAKEATLAAESRDVGAPGAETSLQREGASAPPAIAAASDRSDATPAAKADEASSLEKPKRATWEDFQKKYGDMSRRRVSSIRVRG
jgi:hypothetical protein